VYPFVDTSSWDIPVIFMLLGCSFVVALFTALLTKWTLIRFTVELEYRVDSLEDRIGSEVKKRAQEKSVESRANKDTFLDWAKEQKNGPDAQPTAFPGLADWRKGKMGGK